MQNRETAGFARYLTLAMASVPRDAFPKKHVRGLLPYELPLILLARLAVDRHFVGRGLGHALISEAFRISLRVADGVGCRIITDAYPERVGWYARYGFVPIEGGAPNGLQRMFLDLRTVRAAFERRSSRVTNVSRIFSGQFALCRMSRPVIGRRVRGTK